MAPSEQSDPGSASSADVGSLPPWFRRKLTVLGGTSTGIVDTLRVVPPEPSPTNVAPSPTKAETTSRSSANGGAHSPEKLPPWRDLQRKGAFITPDDPEAKRKTRDKMRFKVRRAQKRWREKQEALAKDAQPESKDGDDSEADVEAVASMLTDLSNDL